MIDSTVQELCERTCACGFAVVVGKTANAPVTAKGGTEMRHNVHIMKRAHYTRRIEGAPMSHAQRGRWGCGQFAGQ